MESLMRQFRRSSASAPPRHGALGHGRGQPATRPLLVLELRGLLVTPSGSPDALAPAGPGAGVRATLRRALAWEGSPWERFPQRFLALGRPSAGCTDLQTA